MTPSVGSVYTGHITEITDVHAYVLFRKPADIRIIGQVPGCADSRLSIWCRTATPSSF